MTSAPGQAARPTPGQTVGPFFGTALPYVGGSELVPPGRPDAIRLHGRVLDGAGAPVPDALIELWQTGPDGVVPQAEGSLHRDGWTFTGWGRAASDRLGGYRFTTRRPARTSGPAFFALTVFARGLLDRLYTRAYLPDGEHTLVADPFLSGLDPERRPSMVAVAEEDGYRFDIRLQGAGETVFLAHRAGEANWHTGAPGAIPAVGGAMDLAIGAREVWVMMNLFDRAGTPKLVPECQVPFVVRCQP